MVAPIASALGHPNKAGYMNTLGRWAKAPPSSFSTSSPLLFCLGHTDHRERDGGHQQHNPPIYRGRQPDILKDSQDRHYQKDTCDSAANSTEETEYSKDSLSMTGARNLF